MKLRTFNYITIILGIATVMNECHQNELTKWPFYVIVTFNLIAENWYEECGLFDNCKKYIGSGQLLV